MTQALYTHLAVQSLFRAPVANSGAGRKPRGIVSTPTWRAPGRTGSAGGQDGTAYKTAVACTVPSLLMATNERVGGPGAVNELGLVPKHCASRHRYHNRVRECFCAKLCPSPETSFLFPINSRPVAGNSDTAECERALGAREEKLERQCTHTSTPMSSSQCNNQDYH